MANKLTIHMIGNAHLDPVWLWQWSAGLDEAVATAHSAVKRLHEYPDFIFTCSSSWFHEIIEQTNPSLFAEIRNFVAEGRWHIVGGWYVQPDCNLPTKQGFIQQAKIAKDYFCSRFGVNVKTGYNVDSFGHTGSLPGILKQTGFDNYVFMRPMENEKKLPANIFRWQDAQSSETVTTFRIANAYCTHSIEMLEANIQAAIDTAETELGHTMCFFGVGDHGGGPTKKQIEYIIESRNKFDNAELIFSHPQAFFDTVAQHQSKLHLVKGELQFHSIGCYSVLHQIKQSTRQAEHQLTQTEALLEMYPDSLTAKQAPQQIEQAWKHVLFNQFHDTLGGTSTPSACKDAIDQLSAARTTAETLKTLLSRSQPISQNRPQGQNIGIINTTDQIYDGFIEHELWHTQRQKTFQLLDEKQQPLPYQILNSESVLDNGACRFVTPIQIEAKQQTTIQFKPDTPAAAFETDLTVQDKAITNSQLSVTAAKTGFKIALPDHSLSLDLNWTVQQDKTDTWSHGIASFNEPQIGQFTQQKTYIEEQGPICVTMCWIGNWEKCDLVARGRLYRQHPWLELKLRIHWHTQQAILKTNITTDKLHPFNNRIDGNPGSFQQRQLEPAELPFHDWTLLDITATPAKLALLSPDIFGLDCDHHSLRPTLLRAPAYAHHDPKKLDPNLNYQFTDQGEHEFTILIALNPELTPNKLEKEALKIQQPPITWDLPWQDPQSIPTTIE